MDDDLNVEQFEKTFDIDNINLTLLNSIDKDIIQRNNINEYVFNIPEGKKLHLYVPTEFDKFFTKTLLPNETMTLDNDERLKRYFNYFLEQESKKKITQKILYSWLYKVSYP